MTDIIVIGSFVMDMVARVENFPLDGQTVIGKSLKVFPGGKGANQAVAAGRLGASVEMIGCVGNDGYGKEFLSIMQKENIKNDNIKITEKVPTAIAQVQINDNSENKIVVIPSANFEIFPEDIEKLEAEIASAKVVVMQLEIPMETIKKVLDICAEQNVKVILNPAPAVKLDDDILSKVTYLTPNETELAILSSHPTDTEEDVEKAINILLNKGVKNIVTTLGKKGAMYSNGEVKIMAKGHTVKAIDTVAAGDSFNGALAYGIVNNMDIESTLKLANAVGALTVQTKGAIPSLPTMEKVKEFMENQ